MPLWIEDNWRELIEQLEEGLKRAKQERQPQFLARQAGIATGTGVAMLVASLAIYHWERRLKRSKDQLAPSDSSPTQPISTQLTQKQHWNVKEVQHRLFQLTKAGILGGGPLFANSILSRLHKQSSPARTQFFSQPFSSA
jgi:small conductance mechanosensitive channel